MTKPRTSVGFVMNSLNFGGAEKHTVQLVGGLRKLGLETSLAYLKPSQQLLPQALETGSPVTGIEFRRGGSLSGAYRLANWISKVRPDYLACVNSYSLFYTSIAQAIARYRCPIVEIFHSTELSPTDDWKMSVLFRHFFNRCAHVVYVSTTQMQHWQARGLHPRRASVILNGVDSQKFRVPSVADVLAARTKLGLQESDFVVGICAGLRPEKRHTDLIKAVKAIRLMGVPAKCIIIGDGPCRSQIEQEITSFGLADAVMITGFQSDIRPYVSACDCTAIVSDRETFSIAALESMFLAKPLIMSDVGGAREQVEHGLNGYIFPAGDVSALSRALHSLADKDHCEALGANARRIAETSFELQGMLDRYASIFSGGGRA